MDGSVVRLYPVPAMTRPLAGVYLAERLPARGAQERPFVYTNFISSLDGRISQPESLTGRHQVPPAIANPCDWRLYLELLAQADVVMTSSNHVRVIVDGRQQQLLAIDQERDLMAWRHAHGLPAQPVCVVVSERLQIPPQAAQLYPGPLMVITSDAAPGAPAQVLEKAGIEVLRAGPGPRLDGRDIIRALALRGYARIYSVAGPQILHTLLQADVLDRLYLTIAHAVLSGETYDTLCHGPAFSRARGLRLQSLFLDAHAFDGAGQMFASFGRPD